MNILIDTHIFVRRESDRTLDRHLQDVIRLITELKYRLVVHPRSILEIEKDKNIPNPSRSVLLSKIRAYPSLDSQSNPYNKKEFFKLIQKPKSERDTVDSYLLYCLYKKEVDLFLTEDVDIVDKAEKLNISGRVMNLQEASIAFKKTLDENKTKDSDVPVFCFYKDGKRWVIGEKGRESTFTHLLGFRYIHYLLLKEGEDIKPLVMYTEGKTSGDEDSDKAISREDQSSHGFATERQMYNNPLTVELRRAAELRIEVLQEELHYGILPIDKRIKNEEELEKIEKFLLQRKSIRVANSPQENARTSVYRSIARALSEIDQDETIASITRYLNTSTIKTGNAFRYSPKPHDKPRWKLFPDPKNK